MKLSEAMRAGAKIRPQTTDRLFQQNPQGEMCSCALGAALEARGISPQLYNGGVLPTTRDFLVELFPELDQIVIYRDKKEYLSTAIFHMNDAEGLTRQQIADWLEELGY